MNPTDYTPENEPVPSIPGTYTPGHAKRKLLMILYGATLFALGFSQLWEPLYLMVAGRSAIAEATVVVKTKEGVPDLKLTDDVQIQAKLEAHDRSYVFWNEFRFRTVDGREVDVRSPVGSQLKPLFPLTDANGLPTMARIYYDPRHPQNVVFPTTLSTWFAPGALAVIGLVCMIIGSFLYYWANKPIELPHLPSAKA